MVEEIMLKSRMGQWKVGNEEKREDRDSEEERPACWREGKKGGCRKENEVVGEEIWRKMKRREEEKKEKGD